MNRASLIVLAVLCAILAILLMRGFLVDFFPGTVSAVDIYPVSPIQGNVVTITLTATPYMSVPVKIFFSTNVTVTDGGYNILLEGLKMPAPSKSLEVSASGVSDLSVSVHVGVWLTKSAVSSGGIATISQDSVPAGSYEVRIFGDASPGISEVEIILTASSSVVVGVDGRYSIDYDTRGIPAGSLKVVAGGFTRSVDLLPGVVG